MSDHSTHPHHHHEHNPIHSHFEGQAPQVIAKAIGVTFVFMIIEFAGGWISNSLALVSDAAHMLTDIGAMLLNLFTIWLARRPTTLTMSFGYHRAEILGALLSGLLIWMISGVLIYESILRIQNPPEVKGPLVFVVATIGLMANLLSMKFLQAAKNENINVRAAYLHVLTDSLGSVAAIIAGGVLWLTHWRPIDPIVTILFSGLMLVSSWSLVKESVGVLMESTPNHVNPVEVKGMLLEIHEVQEVHDLHIWAVSSGKLALSVHLISEQSERVLNLANRILEDHFKIVHTTIQVEHPHHFQSKRCYNCVPIEMKRT